MSRIHRTACCFAHCAVDKAVSRDFVSHATSSALDPDNLGQRCAIHEDSGNDLPPPTARSTSLENILPRVCEHLLSVMLARRSIKEYRTQRKDTALNGDGDTRRPRCVRILFGVKVEYDGRSP